MVSRNLTTKDLFKISLKVIHKTLPDLAKKYYCEQCKRQKELLNMNDGSQIHPIEHDCYERNDAEAISELMIQLKPLTILLECSYIATNIRWCIVELDKKWKNPNWFNQLYKACKVGK